MSLLVRLFGSGRRTALVMKEGDQWASSELFPGTPVSASGVEVTPDVALTIPAFYRAVVLIANTIAKLPLKVYERDEDGGKEPAPKHAAYRVLRRRPNDFMTAYDMKWLLEAQRQVHGNAYALIVRNGRQEPAALLPLDPRRSVTFPVRRNGVGFVVTNFMRANQAILPLRDVLHLKSFFDGLTGHSVIEHAAGSFGNAIATERFGGAFFRNAATPRFVLEHPGHLSAKAARKLLEAFQAWHSGLENSHKAALLEEGMKAHALSLSAEDAQLIEARKLNTRDVAVWTGITPHLVGDDSRTSLASLEQEAQTLLDHGIDPWLVSWEEECEAKLLTEEQNDRETHAIEFTRQALLRADLPARATFYNIAVTNGIMSRNEIRARENLPPVEGGDDFLVPMNLQVVGEEPEPTPAPAPMPEPEMDPDDMPEDEPEDDDERARVSRAVEGVVRDAALRCVRRLTTAATRAGKSPERFLERLEALEEDHAQVLAQTLIPAWSLAIASRGGVVATDPLVEGLLGRVRDELLDVAGCAPADLPAATARWAETSETALVDLIRNRLLEG